GCGGAPGGGGGGRGGATPLGPFVLPGTYTVTLVVDGKDVESQPLKVSADAEVALTDAERKASFDRAIEVHELQRTATEVAGPIGRLNTRAGAAANELVSRKDVPSSVKSQFEVFRKELTAVAAKFLTPPAFGGAATPNPSVMARIGQAKGGLMAGMQPTETTLKAYEEAKAMTPAAVTEARAIMEKAKAISAMLAKHKITLDIS
ncbi:MAG: hypothetical protein M3Q55_05540, partial [Acidobacteriota bacterium]|nr:hypothetical protein [Acidobacteriota bacterium]